METVKGGCLCGDVQFETPAEPIAQILCHCSHCQVVSGAQAYAAYIVPIESVALLQGELGGHPVTADSGNTNTRKFCTSCGSRVWAEIPEIGFASVNGMALPSGHFQPQGLHRKDNAPDWCLLDERIPDFPADT